MPKEIGTPIVRTRRTTSPCSRNFTRRWPNGASTWWPSPGRPTRFSPLNYDALTFLPGIAPVLEALHRDHLLAVISSNGSRRSGRCLRFRYDGYFQDIFGSDFLFSKVVKINHALEAFGWRRTDLLHRGHRRRRPRARGGRREDRRRRLGLARPGKAGRRRARPSVRPAGGTARPVRPPPGEGHQS